MNALYALTALLVAQFIAVLSLGVFQVVPLPLWALVFMIDMGGTLLLLAKIIEKSWSISVDTRNQ